jgi:hypothetical protein
MDKTDIEAAIGTLDTLIQVFAVLVAIGIVGEVGFGVRHWILNRRLHIIQNSEDLARTEEIAELTCRQRLWNNSKTLSMSGHHLCLRPHLQRPSQNRARIFR